MKALVLLLGVVLVCDGQIPLADDLAQLSGEWNTLLLSSNNFDKISNGPFHGFMHKIDVDIPHSRILFKFALQMNGVCTEKSVVGTIGRDKIVTLNYVGQNTFRTVYHTPHSIIIYNVNVDSSGQTTKVLGLLGKRAHPEKQDVARFMQLMREHHIPEANIINMSEAEKCPKNKNSDTSSS